MENSTFPLASLPVPATTLCSILNYLRLHQRLQDLPEVTGQALQDWLAKAQADGHRQRRSPLHGYQWKDLFLPDGTRLRAWNREEYRYATVVGDDIIYQGRKVSPNQFNTAVPGMHRNAWRDVALLFPGEQQWKLASRHRRERTAGSTPGTATSAVAAAPAPHSVVPVVWNGINRREGHRRQQDLLLD